MVLTQFLVTYRIRCQILLWQVSKYSNWGAGREKEADSSCSNWSYRIFCKAEYEVYIQEIKMNLYSLTRLMFFVSWNHEFSYFSLCSSTSALGGMDSNSASLSPRERAVSIISWYFMWLSNSTYIVTIIGRICIYWRLKKSAWFWTLKWSCRSVLSALSGFLSSILAFKLGFMFYWFYIS